MDKLAEINHGAKVVLGASILFLIISFFNWQEVDLGAFGEAGVSMWNGVGWIAGLLAIAIIVWQAIRLSNINLEIGVGPAMVTAFLAVLLAPLHRHQVLRGQRVPHVGRMGRAHPRDRDRRRRVGEHEARPARASATFRSSAAAPVEAEARAASGGGTSPPPSTPTDTTPPPPPPPPGDDNP